MERYSIELAIDLLQRLDLVTELREWRSAAELCAARLFQPRFAPALEWLLQRLLETGCIESGANERVYRLGKPLWQPDLVSLRDKGLEIDPANKPTFELLEYVASCYPVIARGEQNGEQALFDPRGVALWLSYFNNDNVTYAINNWIGAIVAAELLARKTKVRILELGAGAGSGTQSLLECLDSRGLLQRIERYVVSEPNAFFRRRNQRDLSIRYPHLPLEWQAFDIDTSWQLQGTQPGEFDLVYGVNVLHVARDLFFTLTQARTALAPQGWIVASECIRPFAGQPIYTEMIFQVLDSFTKVTIDPDFRPNAGFLTAQNWRRGFSVAGFVEVQVEPNVDAIREVYRHFFTGAICARANS